MEYSFMQKKFQEKMIGTLPRESDLEIKKKKEITQYFNRMTKPIEVYRSMFKKGYVNRTIAKYTLEGTVRSGKKKTFRMEDLAPIVYLHFKIHDQKEHQKEYIMLDEAQDLSLVQILTLLQISKNQNITIAGDLAQSIIPPFYIKDWNNVIDLFKRFDRDDYSYYQLNRCYRTTLEIIDYANKIFKNKFPKTYKLPEAVLRHGEDIKTIENDETLLVGPEGNISKLIEIVREEFNKGSVTCALICPDKNYAQKVYEKIAKYQNILGKDIVDFSREDYKTGLLVLPVENAKGLEFDTVILLDVNSNTYPDTELSVRLLYVAITRALHRLIVITNRNKSPLLI